MDTKDILGNGVGGGEVLDFWGNASLNNPNSPFLNNELIRQFHMIPILRVIIVLIIIYLMVRIIMGMFNVKTLKRGKGIISELDYVEKIRKRDASIIRYNRLISRITKITESTMFRSNKDNKEYLEYNIDRAGVKIPGGSRSYKADEFNAIVVSITTCIIVVSLLVGLFANASIGIVMALFTLMMAGTLPMTYLRQMVKSKDDEIRENFPDFYLMLHYVIIAGAKTPLTGIMRSYAKTTESKEMKHMVDVCNHYMDTYGEYEGTRYITRAYREIPVMGKLMRLIRQSNEGGEVEQELMGFRAELLEEKRYAKKRRADKLVTKAQLSFNILLPILFQAVISAMSIYLSDMGLITTFVA